MDGSISNTAANNSPVLEELINISDKLGPSFIDISSPIAVVFAACLAAIWASKTIKAHEAISRKRMTMEYLLERSRDEKFASGWSMIMQANKAPKVNIKVLADPKKNTQLEGVLDEGGNKIKCKDARVLMSHLLNQYEYMAAGITEGIYDENLLLKSTKKSTTKLFDMTEVLIKQIRKNYNNENAYSQFEKLAIKWKALPLGPVTS